MKKSIFNSIRTFVRKHDRIILASISILVVVAGATMILLLMARTNNPLPADIRGQLTFSPLIIFDKDPAYKTSNYKFTTAENSLKILSYLVSTPNGNVSISEYIQPPQFTDIPEYKDRFLSNVIQKYDTVPTAAGTIYLGQLSKQDNNQIGVMIESGLVIFLRPSKTLSSDEWRYIGDQLMIYRNS